MDNRGKPNHIEDYLSTVRTGQWFGWNDSKNKIYENLIVYDGGNKPTELECENGLTAMQVKWDSHTTLVEELEAKLADDSITFTEMKELMRLRG